MVHRTCYDSLQNNSKDSIDEYRTALPRVNTRSQTAHISDVSGDYSSNEDSAENGFKILQYPVIR